MTAKLVTESDHSRFKPYIALRWAIAAKKAPELILIREELVELLRGCTFEILGEQFFEFDSPEYVCWSFTQRKLFYYSRRRRIEKLLGFKIATKLIDEAVAEYGKQKDPQRWSEFIGKKDQKELLDDNSSFAAQVQNQADALENSDEDEFFDSCRDKDFRGDRESEGPEVVLNAEELTMLLEYWHRQARSLEQNGVEADSTDALRFSKSRIQEISKLLSEDQIREAIKKSNEKN